MKELKESFKKAVKNCYKDFENIDDTINFIMNSGCYFQVLNDKFIEKVKQEYK